MYIEATVRGYHAYLDDASVRIGEILACGGQKPRWKPGWMCTKGIIQALS